MGAVADAPDYTVERVLIEGSWRFDLGLNSKSGFSFGVGFYGVGAGEDVAFGSLITSPIEPCE